MVDLTILMILLTKTTKVKKKIGSGGDNSLKHHRTDLKGSIHMPAGTRNPEKWVSTKAALALRPFTELWILCSPVLNAWCAEDRSYIPGPAQSECLIGACMCAYPVISDSFVTPMECSSPGSSVHGVLQARILEWVAFSSFRGSSWPRDQTCVSCIDRWILYHWATWKAHLKF